MGSTPVAPATESKFKKMILNISVRTNIVAFYAYWFKRRYRAGFVDVRNPFNYHQVSRIEFENVEHNLTTLNLHDFTETDYQKIGAGFTKSVASHGQTVQTCFKQRNLIEYGLIPGECMSHAIARALTGKDFPEWTARKERNCHCVQMVDIGSYNSCGHRCKYCYANFDESCIAANFIKHILTSTMLIGELEPEDVATIRKDNAIRKKIKSIQSNPTPQLASIAPLLM